MRIVAWASLFRAYVGGTVPLPQPASIRGPGVESGTSHTSDGKGFRRTVHLSVRMILGMI